MQVLLNFTRIFLFGQNMRDAEYTCENLICVSIVIWETKRDYSPQEGLSRMS